MRKEPLIVVGLGLGLLVGSVATLAAQAVPPLMPVRASGQGVSPVFEGWYRNPDGSYNLSFGYLNRNAEEIVEIPQGAQNRIEGGEPVQGLPTRFLPRRHYGVVVVRVPASFAPEDEVTWTIDFRGQTYAIPGHILPSYMIDALGSPASDERPVLLRVGAAEVKGPHGTVVGPLRARVGQPLEISATAELEEGHHPITFRFYKYSGPGEVALSAAEVPLEGNGSAATHATFSAPGDYVVYVRANTGDPRSYISAGQEQCCWSNAYVRVTVDP